MKKVKYFLLLIALSTNAQDTTFINPKVGETWFFDAQNPFRKTYTEGTILATSNGWYLIKQTNGQTNSYAWDTMHMWHRKVPPPLPVANSLSNATIKNVQIQTNHTDTNLVITITIQK